MKQMVIKPCFSRPVSKTGSFSLPFSLCYSLVNLSFVSWFVTLFFIDVFYWDNCRFTSSHDAFRLNNYDNTTISMANIMPTRRKTQKSFKQGKLDVRCAQWTLWLWVGRWPGARLPSYEAIVDIWVEHEEDFVNDGEWSERSQEGRTDSLSRLRLCLANLDSAKT